jgi:hypothetical protein
MRRLLPVRLSERSGSAANFASRFERTADFTTRKILPLTSSSSLDRPERKTSVERLGHKAGPSPSVPERLHPVATLYNPFLFNTVAYVLNIMYRS